MTGVCVPIADSSSSGWSRVGQMPWRVRARYARTWSATSRSGHQLGGGASVRAAPLRSSFVAAAELGEAARGGARGGARGAARAACRGVSPRVDRRLSAVLQAHAWELEHAARWLSERTASRRCSGFYSTEVTRAQPRPAIAASTGDYLDGACRSGARRGASSCGGWPRWRSGAVRSLSPRAVSIPRLAWRWLRAELRHAARRARSRGEFPFSASSGSKLTSLPSDGGLCRGVLAHAGLPGCAVAQFAGM